MQNSDKGSEHVHAHAHPEHHHNEAETGFAGALAGISRVFIRTVIVRIGSASVAGTVAGLAEEVSGYPLDIVKTRMQVARPGAEQGAFTVFRNIIKTDGIRGIFAGLTSPLVGSAFITSAVFGGYSKGLELIDDTLEPAELKARHYFSAGCVGGFAQAFITCPVDVVKGKLQVLGIEHGAPHTPAAAATILETPVTAEEPLRVTQHAKPAAAVAGEITGTTSMTRAIIKTYGVKGLFQGLGTTLIRDVPGFGIYFGVYETLKNALSKQVAAASASATTPVAVNAAAVAAATAAAEVTTPTTATPVAAGSEEAAPKKKKAGGGHGGGEETSLLAVVAAGGAAGMAYNGIMYPIDVIKSRIQTQPMDAPPLYNGTLDCARKIYQQEGIKALFRGFTPTIVRSVPVSAVGFFIYELTIKFLG